MAKSTVQDIYEVIGHLPGDGIEWLGTVLEMPGLTANRSHLLLVKADLEALLSGDGLSPGDRADANRAVAWLERDHGC